MVDTIFTTIAEVITKYAQAIGSVFGDLMDIFYNAETGLTLMGTLLLLGVGIGIVKWAFNLITSLIRL